MRDIYSYAPGEQPEIFQGRGGFVESRHFNKYSLKKAQEKKDPQVKIWEFFLLDTPKTIPWIFFHLICLQSIDTCFFYFFSFYHFYDITLCKFCNHIKSLLSTVSGPRPVCFRYFLLLFWMSQSDCNKTIVSAAFFDLPTLRFFLFEYFLCILNFWGKELLFTLLYLT